MTLQPVDLLPFPPPRAVRAVHWCAGAGAVAIAAVGITLLGQQAVWMILAAPVLEEVIFRDGLHRALLRRVDPGNTVGLAGANALTALAFAAAHMVARPSWLAAATVLPALVIGWTYQRQRSVVACACLHVIFNAVWLSSALIIARPLPIRLP